MQKSWNGLASYCHCFDIVSMIWYGYVVCRPRIFQMWIERNTTANGRLRCEGNMHAFHNDLRQWQWSRRFVYIHAVPRLRASGDAETQTMPMTKILNMLIFSLITKSTIPRVHCCMSIDEWQLIQIHPISVLTQITLMKATDGWMGSRDHTLFGIRMRDQWEEVNIFLFIWANCQYERWLLMNGGRIDASKYKLFAELSAGNKILFNLSFDRFSQANARFQHQFVPLPLRTKYSHIVLYLLFHIHLSLCRIQILVHSRLCKSRYYFICRNNLWWSLLVHAVRPSPSPCTAHFRMPSKWQTMQNKSHKISFWSSSAAPEMPASTHMNIDAQQQPAMTTECTTRVHIICAVKDGEALVLCTYSFFLIFEISYKHKNTQADWHASLCARRLDTNGILYNAF